MVYVPCGSVVFGVIFLSLQGVAKNEAKQSLFLSLRDWVLAQRSNLTAFCGDCFGQEPSQ